MTIKFLVRAQGQISST